jgi:hypothetical protein
MAGLVPAIHVFLLRRGQDVDARVKPGHDEQSVLRPSRLRAVIAFDDDEIGLRMRLPALDVFLVLR